MKTVFSYKIKKQPQKLLFFILNSAFVIIFPFLLIIFIAHCPKNNIGNRTGYTYQSSKYSYEYMCLAFLFFFHIKAPLFLITFPFQPLVFQARNLPLNQIQALQIRLRQSLLRFRQFLKMPALLLPCVRSFLPFC